MTNTKQLHTSVDYRSNQPTGTISLSTNIPSNSTQKQILSGTI